MKIVKVLKTTLKSALQANGTTISVQAFLDSNGETVTLADFGGVYFYVVIKQGSTIEIVKCDGITQNSDGSASIDVATSGRAIPPKAPFTGASTGRAFQTGAELIVTNDPATMAEFAQLGEDNAFTGDNTFTNFPTKTGSTTPTDDGHFVTLAYLNSVVLGDATVSALKSTVTFGEAVSEGDPVYFKTSDGKWWRAYANNAATCVGVQLGIADEDADADATGAVVRVGRKSGFSGLTNGNVYLTDAGGVGAAGSYVVLLGTAVAADTVYVDPKDGDREQFLGAVTGMIVPFAGSSVPSGFLACNGQLLNYSDYPDLLSVIGVKYGLGTGTPFTVTAANDTVDITSHGFSNGDKFILSNFGGALPAGLTAETLYYVVNADTNTFKLSLTQGGSAVDITGAGTGTHYLHTQFKVPDLRGSTIVGNGQKSITLSVSEANHTVTSVGTIASVGSSTTVTSHGLTTGDAVVVTSPPTGLTANTQYYIRNTSANTIEFYSTYEQAVASGESFGRITTSGATGGTVYKKALFMTLSDIEEMLITGTPVVLSTSGTLPSGLSAGTYYFIRVSDRTFRLATTRKNAAAGAAVAISNDGTGASSVVVTYTSRTIGKSGGEESHVLTESEMPAHSHSVLTGYGGGSSAGAYIARDVTSSDDVSPEYTAETVESGDSYPYIYPTGGDQPHNNMQPFVVANWIIKT